MMFICKKTMRECLTPGMCSPFQGCQPERVGMNATEQMIARLERDLAAAQAEQGELATDAARSGNG